MESRRNGAQLSSRHDDDDDWLRAPERIAYKLAVLVYRCVHGLAPSSASSSPSVRFPRPSPPERNVLVASLDS